MHTQCADCFGMVYFLATVEVATGIVFVVGGNGPTVMTVAELGFIR